MSSSDALIEAPATQIQQLCSACHSLGLSVETFKVPSDHPNLTYDNPQDFRSLIERQYSDFKNQPHCPLCRLVVQVVEKSIPVWQIGDGLSCELSLKWPGNITFSTRALFRILQINTKLPIRDSPDSWYGHEIDILPAVSSLCPDNFIGMAVDEHTVSTALVKSWLDLCYQAHSDTCKAPLSDSFNELARIMLVIDERQRCLVKYPLHLGQNRNYAALSYVWGTSKSTCTLKNNLAALSSLGGLAQASVNLSAVITDAIEFVGRLDIPYLWVDSLCIVQDEGDIKRKNIDKMNLIYERAFVTLVAATGIDGSAGLPGVQPFLRGHVQVKETISPGVTLVLPHSLTAVKDSKFQEYTFSKRRLIFLNGQVIFRCRTSRTWREDLRLENLPEFFQEYKEHPNPLTKWEFSPPNDIAWVDRWYYKSFVESFVQRDLTWEADILNAFSGIANYLKTKYGMNLFFGIPKPTLGVDLLWKPRTFACRRVGFPSWSWAGWIGSIVMEQHSSMGGSGASFFKSAEAWLARTSWISWYVLDETDQLFHLLYDHDSCSAAVPQRILDDEELDEVLGPISSLELADGHLYNGSELEVTHTTTAGVNRRASIPNDNIHSAPIMSLRPSINFKPTTRLPQCNFGLSSALQPYTLLFHTLTSRVYMSLYDPHNEPAQAPFGCWLPHHMGLHESFEESTPNMFLYDDFGGFVGLTWVTDKAVFDRMLMHITREDDRVFEDPMIVEIALIAGPAGEDWRHGVWSRQRQMRQEIWEEQFGGEPESDDQTGEERPGMGEMAECDDYFLGRHYEILLIARAADGEHQSGDDDDGIVKERIGIGEIRADALERLNALKWKWRDVLLH